MASIAATLLTGTGARAIALTTLTGTADTFTYVAGVKMVLTLRNATAGSLSPVIDGDGGTSVPLKGVGSVDVSGGYAVGAIAAGAAIAIPLDSIAAYLAGTIAISGATGIIASLTRF